MKTDLIILAAGNSTRFQANKLLHLYQGKPLILHTFDKIDRSKFEHVIVVTQYSQIAEAARAYSFDVVINEHPDQGISSSIRLGLQACSSSECAMFLVADMPGLSAKTIDHMLQPLLVIGSLPHMMRKSRIPCSFLKNTGRKSGSCKEIRELKKSLSGIFPL